MRGLDDLVLNQLHIMLVGIPISGVCERNTLFKKQALFFLYAERFFSNEHNFFLYAERFFQMRGVKR